MWKDQKLTFLVHETHTFFRLRVFFHLGTYCCLFIVFFFSFLFQQIDTKLTNARSIPSVVGH